MNSIYGYENIISKKIKTKPKPAGGIKVTVDLNQNQEGDQEQTIGNDSFTSPFGFAVSSDVKDFNVSGLQYFDRDGKTHTIKDIESVKLNRVQVVKFVDKEGNISYKKVALADVTEQVPILNNDGGPSGKTTSKTTSRQIDLSVPGVQSQIKTDAVGNLDELDIELQNFIDSQDVNKTISTTKSRNVVK